MYVHLGNGQTHSYDISTIDSINFVSNPPPETMAIYQGSILIDQFLTSDIDSITYSVYGYLPQDVFNPTISYDSIVDVDLNTYRTVTIGNQTWFAENLRVTKYSNGDPLFHTENLSTWDVIQSGAWIDFQNDSSMVNPRGKLYNWYAIADPRNVCPTGWRVPKDSDFEELFNYVGGVNVASMVLKTSNQNYWNVTLQGSNSTGFSAVATGDVLGNFFTVLDGYTHFWSASVWPQYGVNAIYYRLQDDNSAIWQSNHNLEVGHSIRCIQGAPVYPISPPVEVFNAATPYGVVEDIDGNVYHTTFIGDQEWMAENLRTTKFENGDIIPFVFNNVDWQSQSSPAYSVRETIADTVGFANGNLYNWYTVIDDRNVCPSGWHVPTTTDWNKALTNLGGGAIAGQKLKSGIWEGVDPFLSNLTNESGFSGVKWMERNSDGTYYNDIYATWWSSGGKPETSSLPNFIYIDETDSLMDNIAAGIGYETQGKSVRCVKNGITGFPTADIFNPLIPFTTINDIDGNIYRVVEVGNQTWMAENLKVTRYQNGDTIKYIDSTSVWINDVTGAWSYYDNDSTTNELFGKLYNWQVASSSNNVCPFGWHVPTAAEFDTLVNFLGGPGAYSSKLRSTGGIYWGSESIDYAPGTNESGLSALGTGYIGDLDGISSGFRGYTYWWTSTLDPWISVDGAALEIIYLDDSYSYGNVYMDTNTGNPIRCVMD